MTRKELLQKMLKVRAYLLKAHDELQREYGETTEFDFEDAKDRWAFRELKHALHYIPSRLEDVFDSVSGYKKSVGEQKYYKGDGVRKALETGTLIFE